MVSTRKTVISWTVCNISICTSSLHGFYVCSTSSCLQAYLASSFLYLASTSSLSLVPSMHVYSFKLMLLANAVSDVTLVL